MSGIYDLYNLKEDTRIKMIGERASAGKVVGVLIDDEEEKIKRYIDKVTKQFPNVVVISRAPFAEGSVLVKFGPLQS